MVAGKVKLAMGFQKSPKHETPSSGNNNAPKKAVFFSRSFGVYFPRSSSSQVQPRPPDDVTELLRLIEELRERESRLKTEILEQKLLKETAAIVPVLENDIVLKDAELKRASEEIGFLRNENVMLKTEVEDLKGKIEEEKDMNEKRMRKMEEEITGMKKTVSFCSSDRRGKSNVIENLNNKCSGTRRAFAFSTNLNKEKVERLECKTEELETECNSEELVESAVVDIRSRVPRVPKPPPRPSSSSSPPPLPESVKQVGPPPPPAPPSIKAFAPPPPPPPQKGTTRTIATKVRRIPEVVEFYHSLMRRDSKRETGGGCSGSPEVLPSTANSRDMIGEIENRSTHLLAIKTDVETQGDFIRFLIKEVENAVFTDIEDVVHFVKWLDNELSYLVDERAVLKHFNWPEQKADALREAAFGYCDLKKLESGTSLFRDDPGQPCPSVLKKMQALLEKLEHGVYSLSRMRESASNRFKGFQIPMDWMLETGIVCKIKLASFKLAMKYMRRVSAELEAVGGGPEEKELIVQGVRFAFRVHQFAGGFDVETMRAFQELRDKAMSCHV